MKCDDKHNFYWNIMGRKTKANLVWLSSIWEVMLLIMLYFQSSFYIVILVPVLYYSTQEPGCFWLSMLQQTLDQQRSPHLATRVRYTKIMFFIVFLGLVSHVDCSVRCQNVPKPVRAKYETPVTGYVNGHDTHIRLWRNDKLVVGGVVTPKVTCRENYIRIRFKVLSWG